jgi:small-conductance mechanosensitive channel
VQNDVTTLNELENKEHVQLKKDFMTCDSMLQFLHPEEVDEIFQQLQLVSAYITQFEETCPVMRANIDTTLTQLGNLKSDIETHYLSDSLSAIFLDMESQHVTRINNQVEYFRNRFVDCKKDLETFKKKR